MTNASDNPPISELRVTVERGARHHTFTGAELDRLFGGPVSIKLTAILFSRPRPGADSAAAGKRGTIGGDGATEQGVTNERNEDQTIIQNRSYQDGGSKGEGTVAGRSSADVDQTASYLAERLDDAKSIAFYRRVALTVPAETIRAALVRALDLRPTEVRRSRAAYFTALIREHLPPRRP